jgi:Flp pilus assembly CpaE family ATPase
MGRVADYLDLEPRFTTHDLISDPERMDIDTVKHALAPVAENFSVLSGPCKGISSLKPLTAHVVRLVDYLRRLAQIVVLDMPYTFDDIYFGTIAAADQVIIVGEQSVPGVRALKTVRDTIKKVEGVGEQFLVINRYDSKRSDFTCKHLQELLGAGKIYTIANDWSNFTEASNNGRLLRAQNSHSPALRDIDALARVLLGLEEPATLGWRLPKFLRRLVSSSAKA